MRTTDEKTAPERKKRDLEELHDAPDGVGAVAGREARGGQEEEEEGPKSAHGVMRVILGVFFRLGIYDSTGTKRRRSGSFLTNQQTNLSFFSPNRTRGDATNRRTHEEAPFRRNEIEK